MLILPIARAWVLALLAGVAAAQSVEHKSEPPIDPNEGPTAPMSMTPAERDEMFAPRALHADGPQAQQILAASAAAEVDRLYWDEPGDGRVWALGASFKASFGADGFTYVPWFGSDSPQNYPVRFVLRSARVGGRELSLAGDARAERRAERVTILRGLVQEHYDLTPRAIEQTIVVAGDEPGDVDVELEVLTELVEDAARSGIQFANELGDVVYGAAHLLRGTERIAIDTQWVNGRLHLHVPAELRGHGPVVIDPIISTHAIGQPSTYDQRRADIAFDATTAQYLVVWQMDFSSLDSDVWGELRGSDGSFVAGMAIDISTFGHRSPRVANLAIADRFLVVTEREDRGAPSFQQYQIWGRTVDAVVSPNQLGSPFAVSLPNPGDKFAPDVGGDPGTQAGMHNWLVVWSNLDASINSDIHARIVNAQGAPVGLHIPLEDSPTAFYTNPRVSRSNANESASRARWLVTFERSFGPNDWDIHGSVLDERGSVTQSNVTIDNSLASHTHATVSSPLTEFFAGVPLFLVTYREGSDLVAKVLTDTLLNVLGGPMNLTQAFGIEPLEACVDSDGCRFAVTFRSGAGEVMVATLGFANNSLVLHEAPRRVASGFANEPALASARGSDGRHTDFGVVWTDLRVPQTEIRAAIYEARSPGPSSTRRTTACQGLGMNATGRPYLGETVRFQVFNGQADLISILVGQPGTTPICGGCTLGIDPARMLATIPGAAPLDISIPCDPILVGLSLAFQGAATGSGTCLGFLRLSDTIDMTVR